MHAAAPHAGARGRRPKASQRELQDAGRGGTNAYSRAEVRGLDPGPDRDGRCGGTSAWVRHRPPMQASACLIPQHAHARTAWLQPNAYALQQPAHVIHRAPSSVHAAALDTLDSVSTAWFPNTHVQALHSCITATGCVRTPVTSSCRYDTRPRTQPAAHSPGQAAKLQRLRPRTPRPRLVLSPPQFLPPLPPPLLAASLLTQAVGQRVLRHQKRLVPLTPV